jgi:hypothetical protein
MHRVELEPVVVDVPLHGLPAIEADHRHRRAA